MGLVVWGHAFNPLARFAELWVWNNLLRGGQMLSASFSGERRTIGQLTLRHILRAM